VPSAQNHQAWHTEFGSAAPCSAIKSTCSVSSYCVVPWTRQSELPARHATVCITTTSRLVVGGVAVRDASINEIRNLHFWRRCSRYLPREAGCATATCAATVVDKSQRRLNLPSPLPLALHRLTHIACWHQIVVLMGITACVAPDVIIPPASTCFSVSRTVGCCSLLHISETMQDWNRGNRQAIYTNCLATFHGDRAWPVVQRCTVARGTSKFVRAITWYIIETWFVAVVAAEPEASSVNGPQAVLLCKNVSNAVQCALSIQLQNCFVYCLESLARACHWMPGAMTNGATVTAFTGSGVSVTSMGGQQCILQLGVHKGATCVQFTGVTGLRKQFTYQYRIPCRLRQLITQGP
jgi:hypothetical protein